MFHTDHIRIDPAYRDALSACGLVRVDEILRHAGDRVAAWSRTTDTVYVARPDGGPGFFLKRYFYTRWSKRFRGMFRGTFFGEHRAQAEFRALHRMRYYGISAVRPVAWGARRVGHFLAAGFLITEEVPGARNLTSLGNDVSAGRFELSPAQRRLFCRRLAEQVACMHTCGFEHSQLFWRNIVVRIQDDGEPEFHFLDARPVPGLPGRKYRYAWRTDELSQLAASAQPFTTRADRCRFARRYFGVKRLGPRERDVVRDAEHAAAALGRHEAQRIKMNELFDGWNAALDADGRGAAAAHGESRGAARARVLEARA